MAEDEDVETLSVPPSPAGAAGSAAGSAAAIARIVS